jgi:threonine dehydrogenase-like Zn-dependent dehydrogenase
MNMNRRDMLKLSALGVVAATASPFATTAQAAEAKKEEKSDKEILGKHQIVVIGGGFGGLTVAKGLKKKDKKFDVLVIEKNDIFMSCPFSNAYLGKLEGVNLGTFVYDYLSL